jgi:hypothetical protein
MPGGIMIETLSNLPAIKMIWQSTVTSQEIRSSFNRLQAQLSEAEVPQYIVLDLTADPQFPLKEATAAALFGPYRHPMAVEWLVIGISENWKFVENTLVLATNERKIRWFSTLEEVTHYIQQRLTYSN